MEILADDMINLIERFFLPFFRLGSFFMIAPIFGARSVPMRIRLILTLVVTFVLVPGITLPENFDALSFASVPIVIREMLLGISMGLLLQFVITAVMMAGHAIATSMGLGFASSADPQNGVQVTIVGQFYMILATLVFIAINGHLYALQIFADSFTRFPPGNFVLDSGFFWQITLFSAQMFITGLLLALPVMVGVLLVNLAFGVMTRAAPQLNVFSIGFPMAMMAGFALMLLTLPVLMPLLNQAFTETFTQLISAFG